MRGTLVDYFFGNQTFLALVLRENGDGTLNLAVYLDTEKCPVSFREGYVRVERNVKRRDAREISGTWLPLSGVSPTFHPVRASDLV